MLTRRYEKTRLREVIAVIGDKGALHIWREASAHQEMRAYFGGIEGHWRRGEGKPDNEKCWLLDAPCWHDGSSLDFERRWGPLWQDCDDNPDNYDELFSLLESEYEQRFKDNA